MAPTPAGIVLVVEDDTEILEEIAQFLRRRNYQVLTAPDVDSGRQALEGQPHPDVLVTDVRLPDGEGLELLDEVQRREPNKPRPRVIVMTGHLEQHKVNQAMHDGAETVLLKPFGLGDLLRQLRAGSA
ncbi:MAG: response regulator [Alphaproteobacteria bacterium]|nr:response regulator [Alphaproteobacteria bacterium]